jgi:serine/threonine protein kinase
MLESMGNDVLAKVRSWLCQVIYHSHVAPQIADFGVAKQGAALKTFCGTPQYLGASLYWCCLVQSIRRRAAPEVLARKDTIRGEGSYGKEADMWSMGVILYIMYVTTAFHGLLVSLQKLV